MDLEIGQVFVDRYFVNRLVGRGSTGQVYEARDSARGGRVAIRILDARIEHGVVFNEREAAAAGRLGSPHLTEFVRVEPSPNGELCIVSQFVDGESLQRKMQRCGRMTPFGLSQLLTQLLDGLTTAHRAGIIHRDLTPRSIFLGPTKTKTGANASFKLIDFGLSRIDLLKALQDRARVSLDCERDSLQYLSPEQLRGAADLDGRSNLYSLGVIAYQAIAGRLPLQAADSAALLLNASREDATPFEELADLPNQTLAQLIRKATAPSPSARFQSAEEMQVAVKAFAVELGATADEAAELDAQYFESAPLATAGNGDSERRGQERVELISTVRAAGGFAAAEATNLNSGFAGYGASTNTDAESDTPPDAHAGELEPEPIQPTRVPAGSSKAEPSSVQAAVFPARAHSSEPPSADANERPTSPGSFRLRQSTVPGIQPISGPIHEIPVSLGSADEGDAASAALDAPPNHGDVTLSPAPTETRAAPATASIPTQGASADVGTAKPQVSSAPTQSSAASSVKESKRAALPLTTALPRTTDQSRAVAAQRAARRSASVRPPAESRRVVVTASETPREQEVETEARVESASQSRKQVVVALALALLAGGGVLVAWLYGRSNGDTVSTATTQSRVQPMATAAISPLAGSETESTAVSASAASMLENTRNAPTATSLAPQQQKTQSVPRAGSGVKRPPSTVGPTKKSGGSRRDSAKDPYNYR